MAAPVGIGNVAMAATLGRNVRKATCTNEIRLQLQPDVRRYVQVPCLFNMNFGERKEEIDGE
jgi:hypothetical protein